MEALSLGLLAFATGGFLLKARANARSNKKEGFNNDSLFGAASQNNMPQDHKKFVADSLSYYNPLASLLDPNKTNVSFTSPNPSVNYTHAPPDNTTSANLFRSLYSKPGPNGRDFAIDDELGEKYATKYRVPESYALNSILNICENTDVKGELIAEVTESNGIKTPIYGAKCGAFDNNAFDNVCGICHSGICTNSAGSNIPNNNMPKGLFVASRLKADPSQEYLQMEALKDGRNLQNVLIRPTLGTCGIDSNINKNLFSIDAKSCKVNNQYLKCKHNPGFATPNCYMCSTDGKFHFINSNDGRLTVRQPTTFTFGGNGIVTLQLYNEDGVTQSGYLGNPDSNGFLTLSSNSNSMNLQELSHTTLPWKIGLTSNGEAAAGKYLMINLSPGSNSNLPYVQGVFLGSLRSKTAEDKTDFTVTALDITSGSDRVFYTSANYGMQMKPAVLNGIQKTSATFKVLIPYLYISTSNIESTYCSGPLILNGNSSNLLSNAQCYKGMPGTYNKECLQELFLTAGCKIEGSGFPSTDEKANALKLRVQNAIGSNANEGEIINHVYLQYQRSWSGLDSTGAQLTPTAWAASQQFCTDSNRGFINPCENLPLEVRQNGPLSDECISYIYTNGFYSDSSNRSYGTYSSKPNAASLFGENNTMSANVKSQIEPFVGSSKKDRFCTEFGSASPLAGGVNMAAAKSMGGIANLKAFYNNIHMNANQTNMTNAERAQYVAQCYGTDLNVEATADPTISQGIQTSATSCGTNGLTLTNRNSDNDQGTFATSMSGSTVIGPIRFVRVWNSTDFLNFSQLVVLDSRGHNVAMNKKTTHNSNHVSSSGSSAVVDGNLGTTNIYHSDGRGLLEYVEIDLEGLYDIVQIIFFNRKDCCQDRADGIRIALYNNETFISNTPRTRLNARYISAPLTSALIQYIDLSNPSGPASCPKMLSGQRGNLLAGQTTMNNIRSVRGTRDTPTTSYPIYNLDNVDLAKSLGGDDTATLATSTAKWIWNHPYAGIKARTESVIFYTNIYNKTNIQQKHYLYYKCDDSVTSVIFNGVVIPSIPSGDWGPTNTFGSRIMLLALPGQNTLEVVCQNALGRACFIAAIYRAGSWISRTDAGLTNYYSATNAVSETGYSWRSYSEPNIGSGDSGIFTYTGTSQTKYELVTLPGYADGTTYPSAKWIWNQPDAGQYAKKPDIVNFYFYINVSGTTISNYTLHLLSDGISAVDNPNSAITINNSNIAGSIGHANYTGSMDTKTFPVVPGRNLLQVSITTSGLPGPGMFRGYITDNNGTVVSGSTTSAISSWVCTTSKDPWSPTNACVYVPDNSTEVPYNCASNVWGSNCTGTFTTAIHSGSIAASSGTLISKTKAALSTEFNTRWGNASMAHGVSEVGSNRQTACRGTTVCPAGRKYNSSSDSAAGKCTPNGVADNAICPTGYTYVSGFDGNSCQKTVAQSIWTPGTRNVLWKTCASYNYTTVYCRGGAENSIGYSYSKQSDGSCSGSGGTDCCDACGRNSGRDFAGTCWGGNNCSINRGSYSFAERKAGISCPSGYTNMSETTDNLICRENTPDNVESHNGGFRYKCETGYTRQPDGSCLTKTAPDNTKYSTPRIPN